MLELLRPVATWGLLGAFVYAGPRFVVCFDHCRENKDNPIGCFMDFAVCLAVGAICAEGALNLISAVTHIQDKNAVSALIGLTANRAAPKLAETLALGADAIISGRMFKRTLNPKGDQE
jgi:hypothetical protein